MLLIEVAQFEYRLSVQKNEISPNDNYIRQSRVILKVFPKYCKIEIVSSILSYLFIY